MPQEPRSQRLNGRDFYSFSRKLRDRCGRYFNHCSELGWVLALQWMYSRWDCGEYIRHYFALFLSPLQLCSEGSRSENNSSHLLFFVGEGISVFPPFGDRELNEGIMCETKFYCFFFFLSTLLRVAKVVKRALYSDCSPVLLSSWKSRCYFLLSFAFLSQYLVVSTQIMHGTLESIYASLFCRSKIIVTITEFLEILSQRKLASARRIGFPVPQRQLQKKIVKSLSASCVFQRCHSMRHNSMKKPCGYHVPFFLRKTTAIKCWNWKVPSITSYNHRSSFISSETINLKVQ